MSISAVMFYIIAALILGAGLMAVTTRKIFRSAVYLLGSLVGIAGLYFWMHVEFIAAVQIVIYVGGIVVLIIFSVFLTQQSGKEMPRTPVKRNRWALLAVFSGFLLTCNVINQYSFLPSEETFNPAVDEIGRKMLSYEAGGYVLPFEVVSILLLAAMIGCIVIALKHVPGER